MSSWLHTWTSRPVALIAWAVALLIGGSWAALHVPLEWVPTVELPRVQISVIWPGASPPSVERYVTAPIERAAGQVEGSAHIESLSKEGRATVTREGSETADRRPHLAQVNAQRVLLGHGRQAGVTFGETNVSIRSTWRVSPDLIAQ